RLLDDLGALPSYYLHYFYAHDRVLAEQRDAVPRAVRVMEIERGLLELYRDPALAEKPALIEERGGAFYSEAALGLIRSLVLDDGAVHEVDLRNGGTLAGLADDDVVEVPARVGAAGAEPLPQRPLAPELLGLVQHVAAYERLAAEALLLLAGVDFPDEVQVLEELAASRGWADRARVRNDTFAVLRAGTDRGWGVAIVCGSGINCLGVAPDGRTVRFPALGAITGDWGGGDDLGEEALFAAARSEDGRGPRTLLERAAPEHFGRATPAELAHDIH